jgi:hypothetical protein
MKVLSTTSLVIGLVLACIGLSSVVRSASIPGVRISEADAATIVGGQCVTIQKSCELVNNACSIGTCFVAANFGNPNTVPNGNATVSCLNGNNGGNCCAPNTAACPM